MKYVISLVTAFLFFATVSAQQKHAVVFNSYNSVGFIAGKSPVAFAAQTENGIKFKNWFFGAGFGIDDYYRRTLPLFGAVKKEFVIKNNSLFLYGNAGRNFIAANKEVKNAFSNISTKGGLYLDAGVGYKIKAGKKTAFFISLGNTLKKITQTESSTDSGFSYYYQTENKLRRISFKLGFQF
jgi:hypothetical protein